METEVLVSFDEHDDWSLAKKLKYEDPVQFHTLVRMHLSFVLDLNTDDYDSLPEKSKLRPLKWNFIPFSKKMKPIGKNGDGTQLTKEAINQVYLLIDHLSKEENIVQEGIFRRSGKLTRQQELKSQLNNGASVDLTSSQYSVHDCASVLKTFLAELQEPLLTEAYFPAYCQIAELCQHKPSEERLPHALQLLLLLLPSDNRTVLRELLSLLRLTASRQDQNKMSATNLATLFTPHLLCPRKLAPEALHSTAQSLSKVVAFMISSGQDLFQIPTALATDIKMYWERRKQAPDAFLNESSAATTVFSFVDRERTAQENIVNPTEAALAQLYAHIQSLPESSKKRRLVKQFNKENGHGTPNTRARSFGDSIKLPDRKMSFLKISVYCECLGQACMHSALCMKHLLNKTLKPARGFCEIGSLKKRSSSEEILNSPETKTPKYIQKLKYGKSCDNIEAETSESPLNVKPLEDSKLAIQPADPQEDPDPPVPPTPTVPLAAGKENSPFFTPSNPSVVKHRQLSVSRAPVRLPSLLTSTPACGNCLLSPTPSPRLTASDDMSPITMSTKRMSKAMQETMMTPRSRKPVVAVSASNICHLANLTWGLKEGSDPDQDSSTGDSLAGAFREYLSSRSVLTASPVDLSFSSRTGDYDQSSDRDFELSDDKIPRSPLSDSLLYVLDGNLPVDLSSDSSGYGETRARKREAEKNDLIPNKRIGTCETPCGSSEYSIDGSSVPNETSL